MVEETLPEDVAKVLQGTHHICTIEVPGREYDLINRLLENQRPLEDAEPSSPIVRRRFDILPGYFVEMELYNPRDEDDEAVLMVDLMGYDPTDSESEEWLEEPIKVTDRIPEKVEYGDLFIDDSSRRKRLKGKTLLVHIHRK